MLLGEVEPGGLPPTVRALLPLDATPQTIVSAVRLVVEGLLILPDSAIVRPAEIVAEHHEEEDGSGPPAALTPRETEVLRLLAVGASNKVLARQLDVSVHTVKFHVASVLRKLSASGRLEAVGIGLRTCLLML